MSKKSIKVVSVSLVASLLVLLGCAYYFWRFEIMREFRWEPASDSWMSRINAPVNTDYPFDCTQGRLGRTDHKVQFLNRPTRDANPLTLIIEDGARDNRVIYKGEFLESIILRDIQYCEKTIQGTTVRSYEKMTDPEAQMAFGSFQFIIFDPKARVLHRVFGEAPGPIYSAAEATVELYPFVREDVLGRYAVRIDTPLHQLPEWYQNPRLYSDPF